MARRNDRRVGTRTRPRSWQLGSENVTAQREEFSEEAKRLVELPGSKWDRWDGEPWSAYVLRVISEALWNAGGALNAASDAVWTASRWLDEKIAGR